MSEHQEFQDLKAQVRELTGLRDAVLKAVREALKEVDIPGLQKAVDTLDERVRKLEKRAPKSKRPPMPPTPPPKILTDLGLVDAAP